LYQCVPNWLGFHKIGTGDYQEQERANQRGCWKIFLCTLRCRADENTSETEELKMRITILIACFVVTLGLNAAQRPAQDHGGHDCPMMQRGDQAMGFSHEATAHHFRLFRDGGEIEVQANDVKDAASVNEIRAHLGHIAKLFSAGDFNVPMFIHDTTPPGATNMAQRKDQIRYEYFETDRGAKVRIMTADPRATDAVHAFLLFQIADHHTGDSPKIADQEKN
jgi:hypothetical protein